MKVEKCFRTFLTVSAMVIGFLHIEQTHAQDLPRTIARKHPTPCLDKVLQFNITEIRAQAVRAFLNASGRKVNLPIGWLPGSRYYEKAFSITYKAILDDEERYGHWVTATTVDYLARMFKRASVKEQRFLTSFFDAKEGRLFWSFHIDGAHCDGLLEGVVRRKVPLSDEEQAGLNKARYDLGAKPKEFVEVFSRLTRFEKERFDKGAQIFAGVSRPENPIERADEMRLPKDDERMRKSLERVQLLVWDAIDFQMRTFMETKD